MILLSLCCCATPQTPQSNCIRDGIEFGKIRGNFREEFWNYYERGLSYAQGNCFDAAIADFKEAAKLRQKDQRQARTYGVEFIDYFPHREMGKAYYELGKLDSAKQELELSINHYPSAKAKFYLDKVLKAELEAQGKTPDQPKVEISNADNLRTKNNWVSVGGRAEDSSYVSAIKVDGNPIFLNASAKENDFSFHVHLSEGKNIVRVEAENILGKKSERDIVIYLDREGPVITIEKLQTEQIQGRKQVAISGFLSDESGVSELFINKEKISIQQGADIDFSATVSSHDDKLELTAQDRFGNKTTMQIDLSSPINAHAPVLLAALNTPPLPKDSNPPNIELMGGLTDIQTVYYEEIYIQAEVRDDRMIESVKINEKPIFRRKGKRISFGEMIKLKEGENRIVIEAADTAGNLAKKEAVVIRKIPQALQLEERLGLSIALFEPAFEKNDKTKKTGSDFQTALEKAFQDKKRFRVLKKEGQCRISGQVAESSDLEFSAELIDTETSEVLLRADVYHQAKSPEIIRELADGMANIFIRKYPILTGQILYCEGNQVVTDLGLTRIETFGGKDAKLPIRLIVYRDSPMDAIIGDARITSATGDKSTAMLLKGEPLAVKANADKVITK
jgi:hypothetical protein